MRTFTSTHVKGHTILQAKSPEAPGATTRWSSTPDGIFDQVAGRTTGGFHPRFSRLSSIDFVDLCRWILWRLPWFQRCYFAVLKKWSGTGTWSICRTINWFGVFPLIPKATSESKNRLKPWDLRRFFCWHVVFLPDVLFSWRWYVFHWILKTRYEKDLGDDFLAYRPEDCWCAMSSQVMSKLEFGKAKSTDPEMNWMNS